MLNFNPRAGRAVALLSCLFLAGCSPGARPGLSVPVPDSAAELAAKIGHAEALVRKHPEHWRARVRLAGFYTQTGKELPAFEELRAASRTSPANVGLHAALAEAAEGVDYLDYTLYAWREVIRRSPSDWAARLKLAQFYRRLGWNQDAAEQLDAAAALSPHNSAVLVEQAALFSSTGSMDRARTLAQRLVREFPRLPHGYSLEADMAAAGGRWNDAVASGRKAVERDPGNPAFGCRLAEYYLHRADRPDPDTALQILNSTLSRSPGDARAPYLRGTVLRQLGRTGEALADLQHAYEKDPGQPGAGLHLAELLRASGNSAQAETLVADYSRREEARQREQRAFARVSTKPLDPASHLEMGRVHLANGELGEAVVEFLTCLRLDPANSAGAAGLKMALGRQKRDRRSLAPLAEVRQASRN